MLKIIFFTIFCFFAVLGAITAFVFFYLKLCAPRERDRVFVISFCSTGGYVLEVKWLISVLTLLGVNDRVIFNVICGQMSEAEKREFRSVFGHMKNVFLDETHIKNGNIAENP